MPLRILINRNGARFKALLDNAIHSAAAAVTVTSKPLSSYKLWNVPPVAVAAVKVILAAVHAAGIWIAPI